MPNMQTMPIVHTMPFLTATQCQICTQCHFCSTFGIRWLHIWHCMGAQLALGRFKIYRHNLCTTPCYYDDPWKAWKEIMPHPASQPASLPPTLWSPLIFAKKVNWACAAARIQRGTLSAKKYKPKHIQVLTTWQGLGMKGKWRGTQRCWSVDWVDFFELTEWKHLQRHTPLCTLIQWGTIVLEQCTSLKTVQ